MFMIKYTIYGGKMKKKCEGTKYLSRLENEDFYNIGKKVFFTNNEDLLGYVRNEHDKSSDTTLLKYYKFEFYFFDDNYTITLSDFNGFIRDRNDSELCTEILHEYMVEKFGNEYLADLKFYEEYKREVEKFARKQMQEKVDLYKKQEKEKEELFKKQFEDKIAFKKEYQKALFSDKTINNEEEMQ